MRQTIIQVALIAAVLIGGYLLIFQRSKLKRLATDAAVAAQGYKPATTPQEAADFFRSAIRDRKYDIAARYCTAFYAEQLNKGATAGRALGKRIDDTIDMLKDRAFAKDDNITALTLLDPFPKNVNVVVKKSSETSAVMVMTLDLPVLKGEKTNDTWKIPIGDMWMLLGGYNPTKVYELQMVEEGSGKERTWKVHIPETPAVQLSVARLVDHYKQYTNALDKLSQEVKSEAETRENVNRRLRELIEEANR